MSKDGNTLIHALTWSPAAEPPSEQDVVIRAAVDRLVRNDESFLQSVMDEADVRKAEVLFRHYFEKYYYQVAGAKQPPCSYPLDEGDGVL